MSEPTSEQSIFLQAIALGSAAERAAYLDEACKDRPKLRAEVDAARLSFPAVAGKIALRGLEIVEADGNLFQIVAALGLTSRFARRLNRR